MTPIENDMPASLLLPTWTRDVRRRLRSYSIASRNTAPGTEGH
jgi:hypothetical protein